MNPADFERQLSRLTLYHRRAKLSQPQVEEWWQAIGSHDIEDWTRAVDDLIHQAPQGKMPSIEVAKSATGHHRAGRRQARRQREMNSVHDIPANSDFATDARVNMLRLFAPTYNPRGKLLPQFKGDPGKGLTPGQQAIGNLYHLADRHKVDMSRWAFMPDGDYRKLKAYGAAKVHMDHPRNTQPPTPDELKLLNSWWVDNVYTPGVQASLERGY